MRQKSPAKTGKAKAGAAKSSGSKSGKSHAVEVAGVALSHPDRVYWDDAGVTKKMLAEYYTQVWDWMQPHVAGRVLALVRCPDGAAGQCFFQKHASAGIDAEHLHIGARRWRQIDRGRQRAGRSFRWRRPACWKSTSAARSTDHLEEADRLVFDLDPGPGIEWKDVIAAAREVRQRLRELKLESFVKTTGGKGLHVVLPIRPVPWDEAKDFCRRLAEQMAADQPDRFTATIKKVGAEEPHLHRLSAQQPRGDRHRALFDAGASGRDGLDAADLGGIGLAEDAERLHGGKSAEAARPAAPRSLARHRPDQAELAVVQCPESKNPIAAGKIGGSKLYGVSVLSTRSRSSLANGFCNTGLPR